MPFVASPIIRHHRLATGDGHRVHISVTGVQDGIPVVVFHGGPGSGCQASMLRPFDLTRFFVVMIDQRGSGRSGPAGRRTRNTTRWLIRDVEMVRQWLGLASWYVYGGSWGATLAIAYAGMHPGVVLGLVLRGTFLAAGREVRGLLSASRQRAPGAWLDLYQASGADRPAALLPAMYQRLAHDGPCAWRIAQAYSRLELAILSRADRTIGTAPRRQDRRRMTQQRAKYGIQTHYLRHACGLRQTPLHGLAAAAQKHGVRGVAVHGTYDPVCPVSNLDWLLRRMPGLRTVRVPAGHLAGDPAIHRALADALTELGSHRPPRMPKISGGRRD